MSAAFHFSGTTAALSNRLHSTAINSADSHVLVEILGVTWELLLLILSVSFNTSVNFTSVRYVLQA